MRLSHLVPCAVHSIETVTSVSTAHTVKNAILVMWLLVGIVWRQLPVGTSILAEWLRLVSKIAPLVKLRRPIVLHAKR
jgi:hypothetical protein